jgi:hypothetical protein
MFSTKIYVLSVFVFSLFNLGQAAPIIDEISPLSTRELPSLHARGIFDALFHKKLDKVTQASVDNVTALVYCQKQKFNDHAKEDHTATLNLLKQKLDGVAPSENKAVKDAYSKSIKKLQELIKGTEKTAEKIKKRFTKLKVTNVAELCASISPADSPSDKHTLSAKPHSHHKDAHKSEETSESQPPKSHPESSRQEPSD